jgi:hypothetical protein
MTNWKTVIRKRRGFGLLITSLLLLDPEEADDENSIDSETAMEKC